jgi:hypothetical protein
VNAKQYARTATELSRMTVGKLWQHYAELSEQSLGATLERRCMTLAELEKRGVRGLLVEGSK